MRLRRCTQSPEGDCKARRVLILSADVGEGHAAAARALARQIETDAPDTEVRIIDGLVAMGGLAKPIVEDTYRVQLRLAPWTYTLFYWLLNHVAPFRWMVSWQLCLIGSRPLARRIAAEHPDVIVSTYPAITVVLAHLRRNGTVNCPTVATITDLTGLFFWARPGIDMHLVMYDESIELVRRIAGEGSVRLVRPLISPDFLTPREALQTRRELGLPEEGRMVVVSGGGWGVGDIAGAVRELAGLAEIGSIVCVAGRNERLREGLEAEFTGDRRVWIEGFTNRMPEFLAAADALVHSTGGVTCLEANATGTPVISYGLPVGHARLNTEAMARLHLLRLAEDPRELGEQVRASFNGDSPRRERCSPADRPAAAQVVLEAPRRVRVLPRWQVRARTAALTCSLLALFGTWTLSTDELTGIASALIGRHALKEVPTDRPDVGLIVSVAPGNALPLARLLASAGVRASIADGRAPARSMSLTLHTLREEIMPEIPHTGGFLHWMSTRGTLTAQIRADGCRQRCYYLAPPHGLTVGQYLLASTTGESPVAGALRLKAAAPPPHLKLRDGDVLVVSANGSASSLAGVRRLLGWLAASGLRPEALGTLVSQEPAPAPTRM